MEARTQSVNKRRRVAPPPDLGGKGKTTPVLLWSKDPKGDWHYAQLLVPKDAKGDEIRKIQTEQVAKWFIMMEERGYHVVQVDGTRDYLNPEGPLSAAYSGYNEREYDMYIVRAKFLRHKPRIITLSDLEVNVELARKHGINLDALPYQQFNEPMGFFKWHLQQQQQGRD